GQTRRKMARAHAASAIRGSPTEQRPRAGGGCEGGAGSAALTGASLDAAGESQLRVIEVLGEARRKRPSGLEAITCTWCVPGATPGGRLPPYAGPIEPGRASRGHPL